MKFDDYIVMYSLDKIANNIGIYLPERRTTYIFIDPTRRFAKAFCISAMTYNGNFISYFRELTFFITSSLHFYHFAIVIANRKQFYFVHVLC